MIFIALALAALALCRRCHAELFRGQLHLHTNLSDADGSPDTAAAWYSRLGFDFIFFSDHAAFHDPRKTVKDPPEGLLMLGAKEFTFICKNRLGRSVPFDINALGINADIAAPKTDGSFSAAAEECVGAILEAGGIPMLNHPNFRFAYSFEEIGGLKMPYLLEVINMHSMVPNEGSAAYPSHERIWDTLLSMGRTVYGTATDDTHFYDSFLRHKRNSPGMGWILAEADDLDERSVLDSLRTGKFFASTGIEPEAFYRDGGDIALRAADNGNAMRIEFSGAHGRLLASFDGPSAVYRIKGDEMYVRAKVYDTDERVLLTQPVFLDGRDPVIGLPEV